MKHSRGNGRPKQCFGVIKNGIMKKVNKNPKILLWKLSIEMKTVNNISVKQDTIRYCIYESSIYAYAPIKKPLLQKMVF